MALRKISTLFLAASLAISGAFPALAQGAGTTAVVVAACGTPPATYTAGQVRQVTQDVNGQVCQVDSGGGTITANQGTPNAGGATSSWPVQGAGVAGTPAGGVVSVQGVASGTTLPVTASQATGTNLHAVLDTTSTTAVTQATAANLNATVVGTGTLAVQNTAATPAGSNLIGNVGNTSLATATSPGTTIVSSSALESNHVLKSSAGNLYSVYVTTGAVQGWLLTYNGTSAPTAGGAAIAPVDCVYAPANTTTGLSMAGDPPDPYATGIVAVFSSSGCLTNTASSTVFFKGRVK